MLIKCEIFIDVDAFPVEKKILKLMSLLIILNMNAINNHIYEYFLIIPELEPRLICFQPEIVLSKILRWNLTNAL